MGTGRLWKRHRQAHFSHDDLQVFQEGPHVVREEVADVADAEAVGVAHLPGVDHLACRLPGKQVEVYRISLLMRYYLSFSFPITPSFRRNTHAHARIHIHL